MAILIVDDEPSICWALEQLSRRMGYAAVTASTAERAIELAAQETPQAVVLDIRLPGIDGLSAIRELRQHTGAAPIIVITAFGDLETAVQAINAGVFEYIVKPFDLNQIEQVLTRALEPAVESPATSERVEGLVGSSLAMQEVFKRIALAAPREASVLLQGESGVGKELAARAIHRYSRRSDGPFIAVNVAALSPALAESELFGHVRGAFTGAEQARKGLLVEASGGTLFLDEVADIPLPTQVKLLRCLEQGEVTPVGADRPTPTSFRVVSATHRDLQRLTVTGEFRHDLYFRLSTFQIDLPPLRSRPGDIRELARHFLASLADGPAGDSGASAGSDSTGAKKKNARISEAALAELESRSWWGNVRELRNAVEHALILARDAVIEPDHLPAPAPPTHATPQGSPQEQLAALLTGWTEEELATGDLADLHQRLLNLVEPPVLAAAVAHSRGQVAAAARVLGMHRTTLKKKLEQYGIDE
ncbi:sigma-54-dependent transcriptional regulator [Lignipirellula cremea]|uniref:DNA-binding transcriptional regulator NtrC n=1 Tax=Lignipirellula cremea TaxID=2528010 RepID=A0A518E0E6_9BACT|nr:sigma-54 dependent transcriptional regulator [Lignipirellula cremea]QDU97564.1 Nitrogen regulation protein NR(I) [Lignipirellula cremea]